MNTINETPRTDAAWKLVDDSGGIGDAMREMEKLEKEYWQLLHALKLALPCVEYAEIETAAKGQDGAHEKCLTALEWIRPILANDSDQPRPPSGRAVSFEQLGHVERR